MAEGSRADCIQTISPRVQVSTRVRTCIPYWRALIVRWQMSRLVCDSVPVHLHRWLSAAPDSLLSATELSQSPLHVSGTVCLPDLVTSAPSVAVFGPGLKLTCLTFPTPVVVQCLRSDSSCFGHYNRSCLLTYLLPLRWRDHGETWIPRVEIAPCSHGCQLDLVA